MRFRIVTPSQVHEVEAESIEKVLAVLDGHDFAWHHFEDRICVWGRMEPEDEDGYNTGITVVVREVRGRHETVVMEFIELLNAIGETCEAKQLLTFCRYNVPLGYSVYHVKKELEAECDTEGGRIRRVAGTKRYWLVGEPFPKEEVVEKPKREKKVAEKVEPAPIQEPPKEVSEPKPLPPDMREFLDNAASYGDQMNEAYEAEKLANRKRGRKKQAETMRRIALKSKAGQNPIVVVQSERSPEEIEKVLEMARRKY